MNATALYGLYPDHGYAMSLAAAIAAEAGERMKVRRFNPTRLWEIVYAAEEDTNG